jgi:hypothetical protein
MPKRKKDTKFIRATLDLCESNVVTSMKCHWTLNTEQLYSSIKWQFICGVVLC